MEMPALVQPDNAGNNALTSMSAARLKSLVVVGIGELFMRLVYAASGGLART
jgi:hypothetical protein